MSRAIQSVVSVVMLCCTGLAPLAPSAATAGTAASYTVALGGQFAGDAGTAASMSFGATSARGFVFDATVATTTDAESGGIAIDPRYYSLGFGKQFSAWRLALSYSAFEDGVQVETQDLGAVAEWHHERGSIALHAAFGNADEIVVIPLRSGGAFATTLTTDRIGLGLSGTLNVGDSVTLNVGFRGYDYDPSAARLAARPRLQSFVTHTVFTSQRGIVDSTWNVGATATFGRVTAGLDFAQSDDLNGGGSSNDLRLSLSIPLSKRWSLDLGAGQFDSSGRAVADDSSTYGSVGVRFSGR